MKKRKKNRRNETGQGSGWEEGQVDMWMGYDVCEWMDG